MFIHISSEHEETQTSSTGSNIFQISSCFFFLVCFAAVKFACRGIKCLFSLCSLCTISLSYVEKWEPPMSHLPTARHADRNDVQRHREALLSVCLPISSEVRPPLIPQQKALAVKARWGMHTSALSARVCVCQMLLLGLCSWSRRLCVSLIEDLTISVYL